MADQDDTSDPTAPASLEVAVTAGDAEEDLTALLQLHDELSDHYQPSGPVEVLLVDRIVGLHWRLRRVGRVERGAIAGRTQGTINERAEERNEEAVEEQRYSFGTRTLDSSNPVVFERSLEQIVELRRTVKAREPLCLEDDIDTLRDIFGRDDEGVPAGLGGELAILLAILEDDGAGMEGVPVDERPERVEKIHRKVVRQLGKVIKALEQLRVLAQVDADAEDRAAIEAQSLPQAHELQALARYEQHLVKSLDVAETTLRRQQARRRMRTAISQSYRDRFH